MSLSSVPLRTAWCAARANFVPGLLLQAFAGALVACYLLHPPTRAALESLAAFRSRIGWPFAVVSTALFGAVLPFLVLHLNPATRPRYRLPQRLVLTLFWGYKGLEISAFYALQAWWFGEGQSVGVILAKTMVDQFIYGPLIAIPGTWLVYTWVQVNFDRQALWAELQRPQLYRQAMLPLLIAGWSVWLPAVAIIYVLPTALQLPLQNIVCCFFTLLIVFITRSTGPASDPAATGARA